MTVNSVHVNPPQHSFYPIDKIHSKRRFDLSPEDYAQIIALAKNLNFPKSFMKKNAHDLSTYIKSNDFQALLRIKINKIFNSTIKSQFRLDLIRPDEIRAPQIIESLKTLSFSAQAGSQ